MRALSIEKYGNSKEERKSREYVSPQHDATFA
jgi:hypothetical protein